MLGGTSSSASPWLWQLRHTTVRSRTPPYGDRSQAPEPKTGKSARSTKPYGDRRGFTRECGLQILDAPVPQMVDSVLEFFRRVIDVPMISSSSSCPSRAALSEPLMVEQLVEVPTIISFSSLQRSGVDIPVPGGGGPSSGLHGFFPRQRSTASPSSTERISERIVEQIVDHSSEERISERIVETSAFP